LSTPAVAVLKLRDSLHTPSLAQALADEAVPLTRSDGSDTTLLLVKNRFSADASGAASRVNAPRAPATMLFMCVNSWPANSGQLL